MKLKISIADRSIGYDIGDIMNIKDKEFIFDGFGVSGREDEVKSGIEAFAKDRVNEIIYDTTGSLICVKEGKGKEPKKIMLSAHMDTIGFIVTFIDEKGFIRFSEVGFQPVAYILGKRVKFENGAIGVVGIEKAVDIDKRGFTSNLKKEKMFIDIGVGSREEALKQVKIGETGAVFSPYAVTENVITGGWMDDRIGCFVLLEVMEKLKSNPDTVYFVFSSQEEVGLRGARTTAYRLQPDVGLAVDVTGSSDLPENDVTGSAVMGKGAAIKVMDRGVIVQRVLVDYLIDLAEKNRIPYQKDVLAFGATDAHSIQLSKSGTLAGGISIPARYIHSAGEMCSLHDIKACIDLTLKFCESKFDL